MPLRHVQHSKGCVVLTKTPEAVLAGYPGLAEPKPQEVLVALAAEKTRVVSATSTSVSSAA